MRMEDSGYRNQKYEDVFQCHKALLRAKAKSKIDVDLENIEHLFVIAHKLIGDGKPEQIREIVNDLRDAIKAIV